MPAICPIIAFDISGIIILDRALLITNRTLKSIIMDTESILQNHSDTEKGAYLGAIASLATADRSASEEELHYIVALCEAASLSDGQKQMVMKAATEQSGETLQQCLDMLKSSELRFSLITDLIAFAESDNNYSEEEKIKVQQIAQYLNINQQQFSLLNQYTQTATQQAATPQQAASPNFLSGTGLGDKLQSAGINTGSLLKGLVGIVGPILLSRMLSRGTGGNMQSRMGGGGLGSLINILGGGRGLGSTGGLLARVLRGVF